MKICIIIRIMKTDTCFYVISWIIMIGLVVIGILHHTGLFTPTDDLAFPCFFRSATGLYCPGCGGTHAVISLVEGHLTDSFLAHPIILYVTACALVDIAANTVSLIRSKLSTRSCDKDEHIQAGQPKHHHEASASPYVLHFRMIYLYVGIAILFIQWIIKNILLLAA